MSEAETGTEVVAPAAPFIDDGKRKKIMTKKKPAAKLVIGENKSEVFCVRFSPDNLFVGAACGDGKIRIYNSNTGRPTYVLDTGSSLPATCIRFRPPGASAKTRNVLLATSSEGGVQHWHVTSGKCLHTSSEEGNQVYCVDYNTDASKFATAGKDYKIRLYDEATKSHVSTLSGGFGDVTAGHANRVFSLKFNPRDDNVLVTGGWDNTIQFWDVRVDHAIRSIFGPHVCGDAVDIHGSTVVSGSWRPDSQLQTWDFGTGKLMQDIPWVSAAASEPCLLYAARWSEDGEIIVAGGSGSNEAKIFDSYSGQSIGTISGLTRAVYTVDVSSDNKMVAVAGGDASIRLLDLKEREKKPKE